VEEEDHCPEGTVRIDQGARNGTEWIDDDPVGTTGRVFHNCGKGFGSNTGVIGIWFRPAATCEEAGFLPPSTGLPGLLGVPGVPSTGQHYVYQIKPGETARATNISTYCLGRRGTWTDGPPERPKKSGWYDVNERLNVVPGSIYQCSGDPEDGYWIDLPEGKLWHGAWGPESADSTICQ